jgi:hypothetical protein
MDKKSRTLLVFVIIATLFSIGVLYRKTIVLHQFDITENESGIPEIE